MLRQGQTNDAVLD